MDWFTSSSSFIQQSNLKATGRNSLIVIILRDVGLLHCKAIHSSERVHYPILISSGFHPYKVFLNFSGFEPATLQTNSGQHYNTVLDNHQRLRDILKQLRDLFILSYLREVKDISYTSQFLFTIIIPPVWFQKVY